MFPDAEAEILFLLHNKCFSFQISQAELCDLFHRLQAVLPLQCVILNMHQNT